MSAPMKATIACETGHAGDVSNVADPRSPSKTRTTAPAPARAR
jgi:hypothetical protein